MVAQDIQQAKLREMSLKDLLQLVRSLDKEVSIAEELTPRMSFPTNLFDVRVTPAGEIETRPATSE